MLVIGLSSGTSVDGIDAALTDITGRGERARVRLVAYRTFPYPRGLRERLLAVQTGGRVDEISHLNAYLGELFADAAIAIAAEARIALRRIGLIGSHGQTIAHQPHPRREGRHLVRSTLQIGEPSVIAERTGVLTVADFRPRDLAAGGQGAPLTPLVHQRCFRHPKRHRLVVNLGGITNVTWLPAGGSLSRVIAFDTGPGNMVIDGLMERWTDGRRTMDRDGRTAASGAVREDLLRALLAHPYLKMPPPKSTGRELFGRSLVARLWRQAAGGAVPPPGREGGGRQRRGPHAGRQETQRPAGRQGVQDDRMRVKREPAPFMTPVSGGLETREDQLERVRAVAEHRPRQPGTFGGPPDLEAAGA